MRYLNESEECRVPGRVFSGEEAPTDVSGSSVRFLEGPSCDLRSRDNAQLTQRGHLSRHTSFSDEVTRPSHSTPLHCPAFGIQLDFVLHFFLYHWLKSIVRSELMKPISTQECAGLLAT